MSVRFPATRSISRAFTGAMLVAVACVLSGCGGSTVNSFDPTDMLSFLDTKKPLPGARKPVFPEGVPGVEQGVPKELYKGEQQNDLAATAPAAAPPPAAAAAAPPPAAPKKKVRTAQRKSITPPQLRLSSSKCRRARRRCRAAASRIKSAPRGLRQMTA